MSPSFFISLHLHRRWKLPPWLTFFFFAALFHGTTAQESRTTLSPEPYSRPDRPPAADDGAASPLRQSSSRSAPEVTPPAPPIPAPPIPALPIRRPARMVSGSVEQESYTDDHWGTSPTDDHSTIFVPPSSSSARGSPPLPRRPADQEHPHRQPRSFLEEYIRQQAADVASKSSEEHAGVDSTVGSVPEQKQGLSVSLSDPIMNHESLLVFDFVPGGHKPFTHVYLHLPKELKVQKTPCETTAADAQEMDDQRQKLIKQGKLYINDEPLPDEAEEPEAEKPVPYDFRCRTKSKDVGPHSSRKNMIHEETGRRVLTHSGK